MSHPSQFNTPLDLERILREQHQVNRALQERIQQLEKLALEKQSEPLSAFINKKIALPDKFSGNKKHFRTFMAQVEMTFKLNPHMYPTDSDKISFIGSLLTDRAAVWFTPIFEAQNCQLLDNYEQFKRLLTDNFSDPHRKVTAFDEISRLRQANRDLIAYTSEFQRLAADLDWNEETLIQHYRRGLRDEIRKELIHCDTPRTLNEMINVANIMDTRIQEYFLTSTFRTPRYGLQHVTRNAFQANENTGPVPMEIGTEESGKRSRLTQQERNRRINEGLCIYCGDKGHLLRDCSRKSPRNFSADPKA